MPGDNFENIRGKGFDSRTMEERRTLAKKAGIASGRSRRQKAAAKAAFAKVLGSVPKLDKNTIRTLEAMGVSEEDLADVNIQSVIAFAVAQKAMRGDTKAAEVMFAMAGEDAFSRVSKERIKIDKAKLDIERERLKLQSERSEIEDYSGPLICDSMDDDGGEDE